MLAVTLESPSDQVIVDLVGKLFATGKSDNTELSDRYGVIIRFTSHLIIRLSELYEYFTIKDKFFKGIDKYFVEKYLVRKML